MSAREELEAIADAACPADEADRRIDAYRDEVLREASEPAQPTPDHSAVYLDQHDNLWTDYPTVPPGDHVLPLVWASEQTQSKEDLADRGIVLRVIGWCAS